ncbi:MAG: PspC domain-containing protein, partial [Flavobacteriales bacterium]|nr:PspC domain-containing protein [Flavobacteriales bacterium]
QTEGKDEIIVEVEARLAELFQQTLESGREVISLQDVQQACAQMGAPSNFQEEAAEKGEDNEEKGTHKQAGLRRLFRDGETRLMGGVATGLGHYFKQDPVIIRLAFFVSIFFLGPISIIGYLVLWVITPKAVTVAEQLSMRGESANFENIKSRVQTEFDEVGKSVREWTLGQRLGAFLKQALEVVGTLLLVLFRIAGWSLLAIGTLVLFSVAIVVFAFFTGFPVILMGLEGVMAEFQFFKNISQLGMPSDFVSEHLGVWSILLLAFPTVVLILLFLRLVFRSKMKKERVAAGLGIGLICSFIGLIGVTSIGARIGLDSEEEICLSQTLSQTLSRSQDEHTLSLHATPPDLEGGGVFLNQTQLFLLKEETALVLMDFDVIPTEKTTSELTIERCSFGMTPSIARNRAKNIAFDVHWNADGSLNLPTQITFPTEDLYRGQYAVLTLSMPIGDTLIIDVKSANSIEQVVKLYDDCGGCSLEVEGFSETIVDFMEPGYWLMTDSGLQSLSDVDQNN